MSTRKMGDEAKGGDREDPCGIRPDDLLRDAARPRTMRSSKFLRLYNRTPKAPTAEDIMRNMLHVGPKLQVHAYATLLQQSESVASDAFKRAAVAAVKQWSSGGDPGSSGGVDSPGGQPVSCPPLFKSLNRSLISEADDLKYWMWFVRALNSHLTSPANAPARELTTWRGSKIDDKQAEILVPGAIVRPCMYVASSLDESVAKVFMGEAKYLLRFNVPAGCLNASVLYQLARIEDEKEVLMPPYTPLWVRERRRVGDYNLITMDVLDGMAFEYIERGVPEAREWMPGLPAAAFGREARACIV